MSNAHSRSDKERVALLLIPPVIGVILSLGILEYGGRRYDLPIYIIGWGRLYILAMATFLPVAGILFISSIILRHRNKVDLARKIEDATGPSALCIIMTWAIFMAFSPSWLVNEEGMQGCCQSNLKQIAYTMSMYAEDNDGYLPPPERWQDALNSKYTRNEKILICPSTRAVAPNYAMNSALRGMKLEDIKNPESIVLVFESQPGANAHGGPEVLPKKPRHSIGDGFAFADSHTKWVKRGEATKLKWRVKNANSTVK